MKPIMQMDDYPDAVRWMQCAEANGRNTSRQHAEWPAGAAAHHNMDESEWRRSDRELWQVPVPRRVHGYRGRVVDE